MLLTLILLDYFWLTNVYGFLTVQKIIPAKTMVIEGWVEDSVLKSAMDYYRENHYKHMIVTGIPVSYRRLYANYSNFAQMAAAALKQMGFKDTVYEATLPMSVAIDRTYHTAIATKMLFKSHPQWEKRLMIYSEGAHSRRTKKLFDIALGDGYKTGIIAGVEHAFDPQHFWRTSKGFRTVSNEFVAYLWVSLFFHPDNEQYEKKLSITSPPE